MGNRILGILKMENRKIIGAMILFLFLISFVSAVAISGSYTLKKSLKVYPGEVTSFDLALQNRAGDTDIKFVGNVTKGFEFIELDSSSLEYLVPYGEIVFVKVNVKVPNYFKLGETYEARIEFDPAPVETGSSDSMILLAIGLSRSFKIEVVDLEDASSSSKIIKPNVEQPTLVKEVNNRVIWLIILVIILIIIIFLISWKKFK